MKPLRNLVLVKRENIVQEETTSSGIVLLKSDFNLYQFDDDNRRVSDIISKKKQNKGIVVATGDKCSFCTGGDSVIYKRDAHVRELEHDGENCVFVEEDYILAKEINGKLAPNKNYIFVKISKESREALFTKKIKKDDGQYVHLVVTIPPEDDHESHSKFFVTTGDVIAVGESVPNIKNGDIAIMDYLVDNMDSIIVAYDGEDKIVAVNSVTTRHEDTLIAYQNRQNRRDQIVYENGNYKELSSVIGVFRGDELIPVEPYVLLNHESTIVSLKTQSGIMYEVDQKTITRQVLAISPESEKRTGISKGETLVLEDFDCFDIILGDRKITAVNDVDCMGIRH